MDNKDPWFSYDKVSTNSDAFAYVQDIGNDLSDSLEHLNQGSPVRAKGLPTEKYTAGNTNDVMEGVHEESFLTQTPSKISRRYSPMTKSEYSGYRPPDPVFLSYNNNNQTTNTFLPQPLAKHKTIEDIDKVQINNKFVVNKLSSATKEAAIAPEALELINILNPIEAREIQNNSSTSDIRVEKYTSSTPPIEIKKVETKTNIINSQSNVTSIVVGKPKTLNTFNQNYSRQDSQNTQSNNAFTNQFNINQENVSNNLNNVESSTTLNEGNNNTNIDETNFEQSGPIYVQNNNVANNSSVSVQKNIEIKKPVVTPKISLYTNTIDFDSFVSSTFAEIVDQKSEQKILSRNNINVRKLVTDVNNFLTQNKSEFKSNISKSVDQFFSTYSENNLSSLQSSIQNTISISNNIQDLNISVSKIVNDYFSKNNNEINQSIASEFVNFFNQNLQNQISNFENKSNAEINVINNVTNLISNIKNEYEAKQVEFENIISQVTEQNILEKVVELADVYQEFKTSSESYYQNLSTQINQSTLTELKQLHTQHLKNTDIKNQTSLNNYKQEMMGFAMAYLSSVFPQNTVESFTSSITTSNSINEVRSLVNNFISDNKSEENTQTINSLQYFANDKYTNLVSSIFVDTIENNILNSLSSIVKNYSSLESVQNTLVTQVKNELAESFTEEIQNKINSFNFEEIKTSLQNVYVSQDINEIKNEFENVLNENKTETNSQAISYLNSLLQSNLASYTAKSINVLNEPRYANSVKNLVNENLHNVVANIVHNLSEVNTYSDNKNISTLINNIKIINDRLMLSNAENRLQNFNLIQTSIENFLNNSENNYHKKISEIKINQNSYDSSLVENLNIFESFNSSSSSNQINEIRTFLSQANTNNFNQESKEFIQETKVYSDLINMKNQISSEIDNFVNNTFEAILAVNQNSTVISTQQIISLIEDAISTFNLSSISNKSLTHITNVIKDIKKPELFNNTFQVITSTNILEDQIKNYLLENNSVLADFSLQQIMNTINQPIYSEYVAFQDIKEIINKTTSTSSFGILSEIKQYINQMNSEENTQFISNLKTYLHDNKNSVNNENHLNFSEQLKNFISQQNNYSSETLNQIISSVSNKFENKYATVIDNLINDNISTVNQFVETLYSNILNNESKETILSTLSSFINNNSNNFELNEQSAISEENVTNQINKSDYNSSNSSSITQNSFDVTKSQNAFSNLTFKFDQEFKNAVQNITSLSSKDEVLNNLNTLKEEVFYKIISTIDATIKQTNINLQNYDSILNNNSNSFEEKIQNIIENINTSIFEQNLSTQEIKNLEIIKNFISNENFKLETINKISSQDIFVVKNFDEYESSINTKIQQNLFSTSFIQTVNKLRTEISNLNSSQEIKNYATEIKNTALFELKELVSNFVSVVNPEYSKNEFLMSINNSANLEEVTNFVAENIELFTETQSLTLSTLFTQNNMINNIVESVINTATNNNLFELEQNTSNSSISNNTNNDSILNNTNENKNFYNENAVSNSVSTVNTNNIYHEEIVQKIDNKVYEILKNQISYQNNLLAKSILTHVENYNYENTSSYEEIRSNISSLIANSVSNQGYYFDSVLQAFNIKNVQDQLRLLNQVIYERVNNIVENYDLSKLLTNTINENISLNQNIFNSEVIETLSNVLEQTINISTKNSTVEEVLNTIKSQTDNETKIKNIINSTSFDSDSMTQFNQDVLNTNSSYSNQETRIQNINNLSQSNINNIDQSNQEILNTNFSNNYEEAKIDSISNSTSINNNNFSQTSLETNNQNNNISIENQSSTDLLTSTINKEISELVKKSFTSIAIKDIFNQNILNELTSNSYKMRSLLELKTSGNITNLNNQYVNILVSKIEETKNSVVNETKNEIEKIENITSNFENQTNYQRSSIQVYDEIVNKIEASLHPDFNKVNLNESDSSFEITTNDNEFKNITVIKQIDENEDVQVTNLRIEKVWNKFVQEEVNKLVEEVHNSSEESSQENIYNQSSTTINQSARNETYNKSEFNFKQGDINNTENKNIYNSFNNLQQGLPTTTQETEERVNYKEITEIVFSKIEEKLKVYNVTSEDIIILKHKILNEVTEIYEKRSQIDIKKSEEKMKKEMQDLFIRFLNS